MAIRIIPRLDIKGPNLVKGIHLEGLRVLGKPEDFARYYYEHGADELIYMDVVASLYGRNSVLEIVRRASKEIFIPLTVGGGLRTLDDIRKALHAGADKVSLNTAAIQDPQLIRRAARRFGSSTIVVSIEAIKKEEGIYEAYTNNGREETGVDALNWAMRAAELGAGEMLVTSIDKEGTGEGFDIELTRKIAESVPIPVIACGGAGKISHIHDVIQKGKADAVSIASILHYKFIQGATKHGDFSEEGNVEYLKSGRMFSSIQGASLDSIKKNLIERNIFCRFEEIDVLCDSMKLSKPFLGICLGMQLLMSDSDEFGIHKGLNIIDGHVKRFPDFNDKKERIKVPHIEWNKLFFNESIGVEGSILRNFRNGEFMYFVHSHFVKPDAEDITITYTDYCGILYCSGIRKDNLMAFQFHPEKSGSRGVQIYKNFKEIILKGRAQ